MLSLIEPPGFCDPSLSSSGHGPVSKRVTGTSGVLPIRSSTAGWAGALILSLYAAGGAARDPQVNGAHADIALRVGRPARPATRQDGRLPDRLTRLSTRRSAASKALRACGVAWLSQ